DDHRSGLDGDPGGGGQEDAVPAPGDPARGRPHRALQPAPEPGRGVHLHPRLRRLADVDLAADAGRPRIAVRPHDSGVDDRVLAVPPVPRPWNHLDGGRDRALLRDPVLYPLEKVSHTVREVLTLSPLAPIFELARKWV